MKNRPVFWIHFIAILLMAGTLFAQHKPETAGRFENGRFVLTINLKWTEEQISTFASLYDLDSLLIKAIFEGKFKHISDCTYWTSTLVKPGVVELSKSLQPPSPPPVWYADVFLIDDKLSGKETRIVAEYADYGVNTFSKANAWIIRDNKACFFLPGNLHAKAVYISGSFNQWSTMQHPMQAVDSGWTICLDLVPGKYLYKYIIDGKWQHDLNNKIKERDGHHGYNSVVFMTNHYFRLFGHRLAKRVFVTGSFNGWKEKELRMLQNGLGWELPIFLREGTHAYKFIVDGEWMTDPGNKVTRSDGRGNLNSFMGIGDTLVFRLKAYPQAKKVALAGSFNNWNPDELIMEKTTDGWEFPYVLGAGNYEYKFVVDGKWITDPDNPLTTGSGDFTNSFISFKPSFTFRLKDYPDAKNVIVSGSFNGWSHSGYQMFKSDDGWVLPVNLKPGRYSYKFVVDGKWILDEANPLWEENEYGTGNSVLWVE